MASNLFDIINTKGMLCHITPVGIV
uniref:Uncharacterized protein n=1 Tax=Arundo donax TaxID=35708 RepID=A0A0A9AYY1_ARUDO